LSLLTSGAGRLTYVGSWSLFTFQTQKHSILLHLSYSLHLLSQMSISFFLGNWGCHLGFTWIIHPSAGLFPYKKIQGPGTELGVTRGHRCRRAVAMKADAAVLNSQTSGLKTVISYLLRVLAPQGGSACSGPGLACLSWAGSWFVVSWQVGWCRVD
jgi:hypothetical protein